MAQITLNALSNPLTEHKKKAQAVSKMFLCCFSNYSSLNRHLAKEKKREEWIHTMPTPAYTETDCSVNVFFIKSQLFHK